MIHKILHRRVFLGRYILPTCLNIIKKIFTSTSTQAAFPRFCLENPFSFFQRASGTIQGGVKTNMLFPIKSNRLKFVDKIQFIQFFAISYKLLKTCIFFPWHSIDHLYLFSSVVRGRGISPGMFYSPFLHFLVYKNSGLSFFNVTFPAHSYRSSSRRSLSKALRKNNISIFGS